MSLLADLLSKIKQPQSKRDVPPNLKSIVEGSAKKSADRRRIILLSVLLAVAVITGSFFVYFINDLSEKSASDISPAARQRPVVPTGQAPAGDSSTNDLTTAPLPAPDKKAGAAPLSTPVKEEERTPHAVIPKKQSKAAPATSASESTRKDMLPNLEQVIVKNEAPSTGRNESAQDFYLYTAGEYEMKKDYSKALANYRKALETDGSNFAVMNNIAYLLLEMSLPEESIKYSRMALDVNKTYVPALINLAIAHARSGNSSAAEENFTRVLTLEPHNHNALLNLAVLYEKQADYTKATEYFSQLDQTGDVSGTLGLARVHEKQGNTEAALKFYRSAYKIDSLDNKTRAEVKQRINLLSMRVPGSK